MNTKRREWLLHSGLLAFGTTVSTWISGVFSTEPKPFGPIDRLKQLIEAAPDLEIRAWHVFGNSQSVAMEVLHKPTGIVSVSVYRHGFEAGMHSFVRFLHHRVPIEREWLEESLARNGSSWAIVPVSIEDVA